MTIENRIKSRVKYFKLTMRAKYKKLWWEKRRELKELKELKGSKEIMAVKDGWSQRWTATRHLPERKRNLTKGLARNSNTITNFHTQVSGKNRHKV